MGTLEVDKLDPQSGTALEIGTSGDTVTVPSGVTLTVAGALNVTGTTAVADGTVAIAELDIDGGTDIGEAIVDADLFVIDNGAGGTNRKTAASRLKTFILAANSIDSDAYVDGSIDEAHIADAAVSIAKMKIESETQLSERPATGDEFVLYDASASANRRINYANLKTGKVLQVVTAYSSATTSTSSSSFTHFSGIDLSITPSKSDSTIVLWFSSNADNEAAGRQGEVGLWREVGGSNNTVIGGNSMSMAAYGVGSRIVVPISYVFKDSPGTTSAVRYRPVIKSNTSNQILLGANMGSNTSLILFEIGV